jgi:hypothetical protein
VSARGCGDIRAALSVRFPHLICVHGLKEQMRAMPHPSRVCRSPTTPSLAVGSASGLRARSSSPLLERARAGLEILHITKAFMKIEEHDIYHGPVLAQISAYPVLTTIVKDGEKQGLYVINGHISLLIKYSKAQGSKWSFTVSPDDLRHAAFHAMALNCGNKTVCLLQGTQISEVVDTKSKRSQTITVWYEPGGSMRVYGSGGELGHTIRHNDFPGALLGTVTAEQEKHAWPELGELTVYYEPPKRAISSRERMFDLADGVGSVLDDGGTTLYIGVSSESPKWLEWSDERLRHVETQIKYDFNYDGYKVKVQRQSTIFAYPNSKVRKSCASEMVWKVTVQG